MNYGLSWIIHRLEELKVRYRAEKGQLRSCQRHQTLLKDRL